MIFFSLLFLSFIYTSSAALCTGQWVSIGDFCYYFAHDSETWEDARAFCILLGSDLAVFDLTCEDYAFVYNYAISEGMIYPWIGANDISVEGTWRWVDGRQMDLRKTYWGENEPNSGIGYDCAYMQGEGYSRWGLADSTCTALRDFICQQGNMVADGD